MVLNGQLITHKEQAMLQKHLSFNCIITTRSKLYITAIRRRNAVHRKSMLSKIGHDGVDSI